MQAHPGGEHHHSGRSGWSYLDLTALGRQEQWEDSPEGYPQTPPYKWWNWHDADDHARATELAK